MKDTYDIAVLGSGPGGYVAAVRAAQYGLKVAVIEEEELGGTCLNRGCIPTKSLLCSAERYADVINMAEYGIFADRVSFDYGLMVKRKDIVIEKLRAGVKHLLESNGVELIKGRGKFTNRNTIETNGDRKITFKKAIIAAGSSPLRPSIPGIESEKVFDSTQVLELKNCPENITIIGGGVIGIEFASIFSKLGKKVTIIEMMDTIIPNMGKKIASTIRKILENNSVQIYTSAKVLNINTKNDVICTFEKNGEKLHVSSDIAIIAIGRQPSTTNIGIENIGVKLNHGFIETNDYLETNVKSIFAIGDITGKALLAHVASEQGLVAAANAAGIQTKMNYDIIPSCIYTSPEAATVGLTEEEARLRGTNVKVGESLVRTNGKSLAMSEKEGFIKIITDEKTGEILGAQMIAPRASDMIAEICVAMKLESTAEELATTIHPHPTVSEMIQEVAKKII